MLVWEKNKDGEFNEHFARYKGHEIKIYSDRSGDEWDCEIDGDSSPLMDASDLEGAKKEAEAEACLFFGR